MLLESDLRGVELTIERFLNHSLYRLIRCDKSNRMEAEHGKT